MNLIHKKNDFIKSLTLDNRSAIFFVKPAINRKNTISRGDLAK